MSASDKIEEAKNCFQDIKQSGRNNYQKYDYFELRDILPIVRKICRKFKLKTQINTDLERQCFVLTITDREDNSCEEFVVPYASIGAGDAGKWMQDFGRCQTYARRYLYLQAFEIAVPDEIDNKDQNKGVSKGKQRGTKSVPRKNTAPKKSVEAVPPSVSEQDVKEVLDKAYDLIVNKNGQPFDLAHALWTLKDLCKDKPELLRACKEALKTYNEEVSG